MLRVAVISDTHGDLTNLAAVQGALGPVDWLIHAGDHLTDMAPAARSLGVDMARARGVAGNCDYPHTTPLEAVFELEGVRLLVTHGHRHQVKSNLQPLYYRALELGVRVVIFGHTHVAVQEEVDSILFFNPGSLTAPRLQRDRPSCGILEIDGDQVGARHLFVPGTR